MHDGIRPFAVLLLAVAVAAVGAIVPSASAQTLPGGPGEDLPRAGFGGAVAVAGGDVLVGEAGNLMRPGLVYVYRRGGEGTWSERARLRASDAEAGDGFGSALAAREDVLLVGAEDQNEGRGAAYLFRRGPDRAWTEAGRLVAQGVSEEEGFGTSVALVGELALVGAPRHGDDAGAVFVFRRGEGSEWSVSDTLVAPELGADARFGSALAAGGNRVVVGAPARNGSPGSAAVFRRDAGSGEWTREGKLVANGIRSRDRFGSTVALSGEEALVGARNFGNGMGAVFVFRRDGGSGEWRIRTRLLPFDGAPRYRFGDAIAFHGPEAWIGAPGARSGRGAAYVFARSEESGEWTDARRISPGGESRDRFGSTLAFAGGVAAVGVTGVDYGAGAVAIFEDGPGTSRWAAAGTVLSEAESLDPVVGSEVECRDGSAGIFGCQRVDLISFLPVRELGGGRGVEVNDLWGWTDPETGEEWALVGRVDGTAFVNVTDPGRPVYAGELPRTAGSPGSTWRDIKVYESHAYVVADNAGAHGVQVFDLTRLRDVDDPPVTFEPDTTYHEVHSAHNIVINAETGFAYTVGSSSGGRSCGGGLHMIDIRDPGSPTFAGCFSDPRTGRASTGYSHDAQCVVYHGPDADYQGREICFGSNETALSIADVTDKENPVAVARAGYPDVAYTHQGWITPDHRYFFLDDELDEIGGSVPRTRTLVWDIQELDDPQLATEYLGETEATDHNLYIVGDRMYQSNYVSGLRVVDISDPESPVEIAHFDTVPWGDDSPGFGGSWSNYPFFESGVVAVTSGLQGLFLLRVSEESPETVFDGAPDGR